MEAIATGSLRELAAQGSGWTLFVLSIIGFVIYFLNNEKQKRADLKAREELQEKRIAQVTQTMEEIRSHLAVIVAYIRK
jgi:Na+-transporting methylmalonyl-CoA/oxaloacetate decarboxylase gamma subunit